MEINKKTTHMFLEQKQATAFTDYRASSIGSAWGQNQENQAPRSPPIMENLGVKSIIGITKVAAAKGYQVAMWVEFERGDSPQARIKSPDPLRKIPRERGGPTDLPPCKDPPRCRNPPTATTNI